MISNWDNRHLIYLWDYEDKLVFPEGYSLSRVLPTVGDMKEFHLALGAIISSLTFFERIQLFVTFVCNREISKNASPHTITSGLLSHGETFSSFSVSFSDLGLLRHDFSKGHF
jgi:hypothetical protein